jgi:hypothetical protein
MSGLWTNDRDTLNEALRGGYTPYYLNPAQRAAVIEALIDTGAVKVLDPDDTELVERVATVVVEELQLVDANPERMARAVIVALRQP